jgi:hypothetical protein
MLWIFLTPWRIPRIGMLLYQIKYHFIVKSDEWMI